MARKNDTKPSLVVIFVEGDTDEVLFKALIEYYRIVSKTELRPCKICNLRGVTRYTSKLIAKLQNEYLPEARKKDYRILTVCCSYDTDVFEVRNPLMVNWDALRKTIHRMGIQGFVQLGIRSSIEDWLLSDMEGICSFLNLAVVPKSLKGSNGNAKLSDLFSRAKRVYQKGCQTGQLVSSLNLEVIRRKYAKELSELEHALNVYI